MNKSANENDCNVLIVGAGIAGLVAARYLQAQDVPVLVVDKEERVGGRILTEHIAGGWADTGAQFFTVRNPFFQTFVDKWLDEGLVFEWATGWAQGSLSELQADGHPRYAAHEGLNAICRRLAQDIPVHKSVNIQSIVEENGRWTAVDEADEMYHSAALIMTPPVPISLHLLSAGNVSLAATDMAALKIITYAPCLSAVFHADGESRIPEPGAVQNPNEQIAWLADNQQKGTSKEALTLTMHLNPKMSQLWWLSPEEELEGALKRLLRPFITQETAVKEIYIHRWPHALPTQLHPERTLLAHSLPPLAFAGDAFNGPRVEGAALSGLAAAKSIKEHLC